MSDGYSLVESAVREQHLATRHVAICVSEQGRTEQPVGHLADTHGALQLLHMRSRVLRVCSAAALHVVARCTSRAVLVGPAHLSSRMHFPFADLLIPLVV